MKQAYREGLEGLTARPHPLMRWLLAPGALAMAGIAGWAGFSGTIPAAPGYAMAAWMVLLAWGAWHPVHNRWALRAFAAPIPFICLAYLVGELVDGDTSLVGATSRSEPSLLHALLSCIVFGVPASAYALTGRFQWWKANRADDEKQEFTVGEDDLGLP